MPRVPHKVTDRDALCSKKNKGKAVSHFLGHEQPFYHEEENKDRMEICIETIMNCQEV